MKKLVLLSLATLFFFSACNNNNKEGGDSKFTLDTETAVSRGDAPQSEEQMLQAQLIAKIDDELASGQTFKEAIPGSYKFGMNEKQIGRINKRMARKGDVEKYAKSKKRTYAYAYLMPLMGGDVPAFFDFSFNDDGEMYKGEGIIDVPSGSSSLDILNITVDKFNEWYGPSAFDLPRYNYCARKVWVNGNRMVDLRCEVDGVVVAIYNLEETTPNLFSTEQPEPSQEKEDNPLINKSTDDNNEPTMQMESAN